MQKAPGIQTIDLNADLGEGRGDDLALLGLVTSCNVACGWHAGDPVTMRRTVAAARQRGVVVGAHPSYWDRQGFGRTRLELPADETEALILYQVGALQALAQAEAWPVRHVKAHGALSNQASEDAELAQSLGRAVLATGLVWIVMPHTQMEAAARRLDVPYACEAFVDRAYLPDGRLLPRTQPGAVLADPLQAAQRAVRMAVDQALPLGDGTWRPARIDTLCVHGDTPQAVAMATAVRQGLEAAGVRVQAPPH